MNVEDIKKETSPEREAELAHLDELADDDIDTSDIPEITAEQWMTARRGEQFCPVKAPITIRLDADIIAWFKDNADNGRHQTAINQALREFMTKAPKRAT